MNESATAILAMGRAGDIVIALPMALDLSRRLGSPAPFIVSAEFASILEGCSYVQPVSAPFFYTEPREAQQWAVARGFRPLIAQWYGTTTLRHESNFEREAWYLAGQIAKWGTLPTVFDRCSPEREDALLRRIRAVSKDQPLIAVALQSHSSPFPYERQVLNALWSCFPSHHITNLCCEAERIYDVLGVLDAADCLVTVDTAHLHLARAAKCPVVAITNDRDGGWWASDAPPQAIHQVGYSMGENMVGPIISAVKRAVQPRSGRIIQVTDLGPRNGRQSSWAAPLDRKDGQIALFERKDGETTFIRQARAQSTAQQIGDPRDLAKLRQVLALASGECAEPADIVVWQPDDTELTPEAEMLLRRHVGLYGACSVRRDEAHMGRELFAFSLDWLTRHFSEIPPFYVGAPTYDLCLAALIRLQRGIVTTIENLSEDFFPCELSERIVIHPPHESAWTKFESAPANRENKRIARQWFTQHGMKVGERI